VLLSLAACGGGGATKSAPSGGGDDGDHGGGPLAFTTTSCPAGKQGAAYACTLAASGGTPPYTFSIVEPLKQSYLPEGMALDASTGRITSARVGGQGMYGVVFAVADSASRRATRTVMFPIEGSNAYVADVFPADAIFHHRVDGLPVDESPAAPLPEAYRSAHVAVEFAGVDHDHRPIGFPIIDVPADQPEVDVLTPTRDFVAYFTRGPIPPYAPVEEPGADGDRHVLVYRHGGGGKPPALYELWQGVYQGASGGWSDSSNVVWPDVSSYALTPQGKGTADAAGLPIAPLLLNADEVIGAGTPDAPLGEVRHPVRITVEALLNYWVWPATQTSGVGECFDAGGRPIDAPALLSASAPPARCTHSGPAGQLYRLAAGATLDACASKVHPQADVILLGLKRYGVILSDNGNTGDLCGTPDTRWSYAGDLECLNELSLGDFEPVNPSSLMISAASAQTR
jgi:hypothetical protein